MKPSQDLLLSVAFRKVLPSYEKPWQFSADNIFIDHLKPGAVIFSGLLIAAFSILSSCFLFALNTLHVFSLWICKNHVFQQPYVHSHTSSFFHLLLLLSALFPSAASHTLWQWFSVIHTADYLRAILDKEIGLRKDKSLLSHVGVFQVPAFDRFIILTDAAMIIAPDLQQKVSIIENAVVVARALGIEMPKVAALSAVETVNPDMVSSVEAAILAKMSERGQIKNCIVDGPLAFDNAISKEAAEHKGIKSPVAGAADILLVPDIEAGNILYKSFTYAAEPAWQALWWEPRRP